VSTTLGDAVGHRRSTTEIAQQAPWWKRLFATEPAARISAILAFAVFWVVLSAVFERVPGPVAVVSNLVGEFARGEVFGNFGVTLYRFGIGVGLALVAGTAVGMLMGLSQLTRAFLESPVLIGLSMPAIIWSFLTVMWFGFGDLSPIVTTFLTAVPFVVLNVFQGVRGISRDLRDMSATYRVPFMRQIRDLVLPAVTGFVATGARFAVLMGWNGVLLAEWFGGSGGVGYRARYWYDANQFAGFAAWVVLFIAFIVVLDRLVFDPLVTRAFRWRDAR
jgi:ABC-type nitrate/sulfonate/bicarbonate transport system permease component